MVTARAPRFILLLALLYGVLCPYPTRADSFFSIFDEDTEKASAKEAPGGTLAEQINAAQDAAQLRPVYEARAFRPYWSHDGAPTPQAKALVEALGTTETHGLNPADYDVPSLRAWLGRPASLSEAEWDRFDVALSRALIRLADHLYHGRIDQATLLKLNMDVPDKPPLDMPQLLEAWSKAADPAQALAQLAPATTDYKALQAALARYRHAGGNTTAVEPIAPGKKGLRPGEKRDNVPALRSLLQNLGELAVGPPPRDPTRYDQPLAEAVRRFQRHHGLEPDGVVGGQTLIELNASPAERVNQLRLGLERLRWLPRQQNSPYLVINVPSFRLYGFASGAPDLAAPDIAMDVIVGQAAGAHHTPVFHADLLYVVFRPYWNVPYSITRKELLPQIERSSGEYLNKNSMEIVASYGAGANEVYGASRENIDALYSGKLRLRQRPGDKNALGLIKFVFPNMNSVYLHGTPQQRLFLRTRRDFSHGCIRVENPADLAEFVLKMDGNWDKPRIESAMEGEKTFTVRLRGPIPVIIFYATALANAEGKVQFFPDIYEQDAELIRLLNRP